MKLVSISDYESQKACRKTWQSVWGWKDDPEPKEKYVLCLLYEQGKEKQSTLAQFSYSIVQWAIQTG